MTVAHVLFWLSLLLLGFIYLGYPALMALLAAVRPCPVRTGSYANETVSVVIAAHNEAAVIEGKLASVLKSTAGDRIVEVIVASDGSDDETMSRAQAVGDPRVRVLEFKERRGKAHVLNEIIPQCEGGIVVLTDARQRMAPHALDALLENFADARVGVVSGELMFEEDDADTVTGAGMGVYWRYEKFIRKQESRFASVPGATGALYAIRKATFEPIHASTLLDDVAIPMHIIAKGLRCIFESRAIVWDKRSRQPGEENVRKRRTIAGNAQLVLLKPVWLIPFVHPIWLQFISHKMLRLTSPVLLLLLLFSHIASAGHGLYKGALFLQAGFYLLAVLGWCARNKKKSCKLISIPFMFVDLNVMTAFALLDVVRGKTNATWDRAYV